MNRMSWHIVCGLCAVVIAGAWAVPARAQMAEVKEKPRLYTYEAFWSMPRARWTEMEKVNPGNQKILDNAMTSGGLVGYGSDSAVLHDAEGATHDSWWSSMSMAGTLNVLDELERTGSSTASVLTSATKHWDNMWVSKYYNWHPGSWKGAYTSSAVYTLKSDAPDNAVQVLAKNLIVPLMEKLLADGTIIEYEIDEQAIHADAPGLFVIDYITPTAEGIDKFSAALRDAVMKSPLAGPAFGSMVDWTKHRDSLVRTSATYK
jgi:hypothetical protein